MTNIGPVTTYDFSTEALVEDQNGKYIALFQMNTVAIRAVRKHYELREIDGVSQEMITDREWAIRIMPIGYLADHPHPRDNPEEMERIKRELNNQLDEGTETWME